MRKRWLVVFAAVAVLAFGATGGAVLAQSGGTGDDASGKGMVSRMASILGLAADDVRAAFDQAKEEIRDERVQANLARLVGEGTITQDQADEYKSWIESRPEDLPNGSRLRGLGRHGRHGQPGHGVGPRG